MFVGLRGQGLSAGGLPSRGPKLTAQGAGSRAPQKPECC